jgi:hypothetical protein
MSTAIVGWASNIYTLGSPLFQFDDNGTNQVTLSIDASGHLYFSRNGTQIGSPTTRVFYTGVWYYIELKVTIASGTSGLVECRVDGVPYLSYSGVNTSATGNAWLNQLGFPPYGSAVTQWVDDVYCCDTSGSVNNNYLGDIIVRALMPNGAGTNTQWTPNGQANNYQCVNEIGPDEDTSYISSQTADQIDTYTLADLPASASTVFAVQQTVRARKDDAGNRVIHGMLKSGSSYSEGPDIACPSSYAYFQRVIETDPAGGSWTPSSINALEAGVKEIS